MQANNKPTRDGNISLSIRKSAKRGHCTRAEQECWYHDRLETIDNSQTNTTIQYNILYLTKVT